MQSRTTRKLNGVSSVLFWGVFCMVLCLAYDVRQGAVATSLLGGALVGFSVNLVSLWFLWEA